MARFLTCRVEESRAGTEAEPLLCFPSTMYLDLSIRGSVLANFLVCHEDESRAGMEVEPSCTLDLSIRS